MWDGFRIFWRALSVYKEISFCLPDLACRMVNNALVGYVRFRSVDHEAEHVGNLLGHLREHFGRKTGATLYLPYRERDKGPR